MDKKEIRKNMISKRDNILKEAKEIMDKNIILKLKESEYYKKSTKRK